MNLIAIKSSSWIQWSEWIIEGFNKKHDL